MSPYVRLFVSWLVGKPVGQSVSLSVCFTSHAPIRALVYYELPYDEPILYVCSSVGWLVGRLVNQSVGRSVGRSVGLFHFP